MIGSATGVEGGQHVDGPEPWLPAAQYCGTKGFFHGYNGRPSETLEATTGRLRAEGFAKLGQGQLDPNTLARETPKPKPAAKRRCLPKPSPACCRRPRWRK